MTDYLWRDVFDRVFELKAMGWRWMEAIGMVSFEIGYPAEKILEEMIACQECQDRAQREYGGFDYES